jgi:hypothetical protein
MTDYAQLAIEAKAKQEAAAVVLAEKKKLEAAAHAFFGSLVPALNEEMDKANVELSRAEVVLFSGVVVSDTEPSLSVKYGEDRYCQITYNADTLEIVARLNGNLGYSAVPLDERKTTLTWFVKDEETTAKVYPIHYIAGVDSEVTASAMAETIVAATIRGRFE